MLLKFFVYFILINLVSSISNYPILIILSFDAFRYNYLDLNLTPNLKRMRELGTYSDYLINVFPTKTFPNHHTIATGLYPGTHGVVGNSYFDPELKRVVNMSYELYHFNDNVVPIWRHNEDIDKNRHSASMMWPGAVYPYQGKNITYVQHFERNLDWFERIDKVISWITDPVKPANLVMVYFDEPDFHGHAFGPNSPVVHDLIKRVDNISGYLEEKLIEKDLINKVNIVTLSDHGMVTVKRKNFLNITQYLIPDTYYITGASPILQITPKKGYYNETVKRLKAASKTRPFRVFEKQHFLHHWHYNTFRSAQILVIADLGYALDDYIIMAPIYAKNFNFNVTMDSEFGVHGYENNVTDMYPIFMARGPKIKQNYSVEPFYNLDLFELFCYVLELPVLPNNGSFYNIRDILASNASNKYSISSVALIIAIGIVVTILLVSCAAILTLLMIKKQQNITTTAALNKRFPQTTYSQSNIEAQHLLEHEDA